MTVSNEPIVNWVPPKSEGPLNGRQFAIRAVILIAIVAGIGLGIRSILRPLGLASSPAWEADTRLEIRGDTATRNVLVDANRIYVMSREDLVEDGYEGDLFIRHSDDAGATWSRRSNVTTNHSVLAESHTLSLASDGSLWAAWAQFQTNSYTERFFLRRSNDGGQTWHGSVYTSIDDRSSLGPPVLSMTDGLRALLYTDAETGRIVFQPLGPEGETTARNVTAGRTTHYSYAGVRDGGLSLAILGDRVAYTYHDGEAQHLLLGGPTAKDWEEALSYELASEAAPGVVASEDGFVAMFGSYQSRHGQVIVERSVDGGATWRGSGWVGPPPFALALSHSPQMPVYGAWATCDGLECAGTRIWLAEVGNGIDDVVSMASGLSGGPVAVEPAGAGLVVAWIDYGDWEDAYEPRIVIATGARP